MFWFRFQSGVSFPFILLWENCISKLKFYAWSWSEVPFNNWLHRTKSVLFFISLDRRSDAKINHQINISSNTTFARTLRKYSFDAKLCMRPLWSDVVQGGWLTGWRQLCVCLTHCWCCLTTWPPAAMRKLPGRALQQQQQLSLLSAQTGCGIDPV